MKKLSIVIALLVLAGCGSTAQVDVDKPAFGESKAEAGEFLPITVIKSPKQKSWFGAMLHVPEGFTFDKELYEKYGDMSFKHSDGVSSFTVKFKQNPGKNDAENFLDMEVVKPNRDAFTFGDLEKSGVWSTPFPTMEDTLSCEATSARIAYARKIDNTELSGAYYVWWFTGPTQGKLTTPTFAITITTECLAKDEGVMNPKFDLMRKTFFRLPSRGEITGIVMSKKGDVSMKKEGLAKVGERLFHLQNGEPFAPMWDTLIGQYIFAQDRDRFHMYLVKKQQTPSGLLPHPTIQGSTIDPGLDEWVTDYLELL